MKARASPPSLTYTDLPEIKADTKISIPTQPDFWLKTDLPASAFDLYGNGESDGEFEDMTFTGILHDIEDIINWTKQQDFANPDKIILSGPEHGRLCSCHCCAYR